jgi:hypothetical protein
MQQFGVLVYNAVQVADTDKTVKIIFFQQVVFVQQNPRQLNHAVFVRIVTGCGNLKK